MRRSQGGRWAVALVALSLVVAACGGGGSDGAATTTTLAITTTPSTFAVQTTPTTAAPAAALVTTGAKVVVANASRVDGAAKRMSDQLKDKGFTMGTPTGSGTSLQRIEVTKIFYVADDAQAQAVSESIKGLLGGGEIAVEPMPSPAPTESGELEDGTTVVVAIGNDVADKTLAQLSGGSTASSGSESSTEGTATGGSTADTAATTPSTGSTAGTATEASS